MTQLQSQTCKDFYTNWNMNREKGIFLFSVTIFFCNAYMFSIPNFRFKVVHLFIQYIQYGKNVFLKVFDFEGIGFILVVNVDLKGQFSCEVYFRYEQKYSGNMPLTMIKENYYATFFQLMYANQIHHNFFAFKLLELHQLLQSMLYIELFLIHFEILIFWLII